MKWLKTHLQGLALLQLCVCGVLIVMIAIFAVNYPADLPDWRFFGTEIALAALLALNIFGVDPKTAASPRLRLALDWAFLVVSALLVLGIVWLSGQFDLVYLLSIVCAQADIKRGVWPAGVVFGAANLIVWLILLVAAATPFSVIAGRETALAVGIVFGLLVVTLLNNSTRQTRRAEGLLQELQAAHRELEMNQQREKDLAIAEERVRLARELHDSVTQSLYSVTLYAEAASELIRSGETEAATSHLRELQETAQEAMREMRLLLFELRRPALETGGLAAALQARLDAVESHGGIRAVLQVEGTERVPADIQAELYRIIQEALNNTLKHARARNVQVRLRFTEEFTDVEVVDDGAGFNPSLAQPGKGFGLAGMKERAHKIGGFLQIKSASGKGTIVSLHVPAHLAECPNPTNPESAQLARK